MASFSSFRSLVLKQNKNENIGQTKRHASMTHEKSNKLNPFVLGSGSIPKLALLTTISVE